MFAKATKKRATKPGRGGRYCSNNCRAAILAAIIGANLLTGLFSLLLLQNSCLAVTRMRDRILHPSRNSRRHQNCRGYLGTRQAQKTAENLLSRGLFEVGRLEAKARARFKERRKTLRVLWRASKSGPSQAICATQHWQRTD